MVMVGDLQVQTRLDDLADEGVVSVIGDGVYLVPISIILNEFDSVDDNSGSIDEDDEVLSISDVIDDARHTERYHNVRVTIAFDGFTQSLTCSHTNRLLDGHHRLAAAIDLGYNSVPVSFYTSQPCSHRGGA